MQEQLVLLPAAPSILQDKALNHQMVAQTANEIVLSYHVTLAPCVLGLVVGIIFILDGWRSSPSDRVDLSRKLRGLLYILGGSGIAALVTSSVDDKTAVARYITWVCVSSLSCLLVFVAFVAIYSFARLRHHHPSKNLFVILAHTIPFIIDALLSGFSLLKTDLDNRAWNAFDTLSEKTADLSAALLEQMELVKTEEEARNVIQRWLKKWLLQELMDENTQVVKGYSVYLYTLPKDENYFYPLCHVAPINIADTHGKLPLQSLAGSALKHPKSPVGVVLAPELEPVFFPPNLSEVDFHRTKAVLECRSIMACSCATEIQGKENEPQFVLALDIHGKSKANEPPQQVQAVFYFAAKLIRAAIMSGNIDQSKLSRLARDVSV